MLRRPLFVVEVEEYSAAGGARAFHVMERFPAGGSFLGVVVPIISPVGTEIDAGGRIVIVGAHGVFRARIMMVYVLSWAR